MAQFNPDKFLAETAPQDSGFNPDKFLAETAAPSDNRSALEVVRDGLNVTNWPKNMMAGLQKVDEYTGAPIRKFVTEAVTGKDLAQAPTGAEQAKMLGATDKTYGEVYGLPAALGGNVSPADIYGMGLEAIQDPLLLIGEATRGVKGALKGGEAVAEGMRSKIGAGQSQAAKVAAESTASAGASAKAAGGTAEISGELFKTKAPQNLAELDKWQPQGKSGQMVGKDRLQEIEKVVPDLSTKPLKYHYDMMENPKAMKELKLKFENLPTDSAKKIAAYNQEMVDESARKINETVSNLAGGVEPRSMTDAGYDFISSAKEKYQAEKNALGPIFDKIQKSPRLTKAETMDLAQAIGENSKIGKLMGVGEDGKLFLEKNSPRSGISDSEHNVLSRVIADMNDGMSFKEIQDTRDFLKKSIDPTNPGASSEISKVRSIMLGQLENMAERHGVDVAGTFKSYAKNERARESVEKIIGGNVASLDSMFAANPDKVVQKIFSNPNYAKVVGEYVGPDKLRELAAAYIQNGINKANDAAKGFNPSTLKTWLKSNQQFLKANVPPDVAERLNALADYGYYGKRFLDEVNPSGTAASLKEMLQPGSFMARVKGGDVWGAIKGEVGARTVGKLEQKQAINSVNEMMGTPKKPSPAARVKSGLPTAEGISSKVDTGARFQQGAALSRGMERDVLPKSSAENDKNDAPTKGPDKWANDGIDMILKSDQSDVDRETLQKLKETKSGQKLLIEASTAKNKKAMETVLKKIRTATRNEGE